MTKKKVKEDAEEAKKVSDRNEEYRKEFAELPLEKKIANLVQLESIALGETVSFIFNSPFKIADKVLDVMAEFGFKKEEQEREAARPAEHKGNGSDSETKAESKDTKTEAKDHGSRISRTFANGHNTSERQSTSEERSNSDQGKGPVPSRF
jgi:hypothetical protein